MKHCRKIWLAVFASILLFYSCTEKKEGIQVAVAANFYSTMQAIADSFKAEHPDADIKIIKGSSGKLAGQILNGAAFDIFLSADMEKAAALYEKGFTKEEPVVYAKGALVLFTKNNIPLSPDLQTLTAGSIKHIAIANPILAPYGAAAVEAMRNSGVNIDTTKFVYGENIIQTYQHIDMAADVGFISKSLILEDKTGNKYTEGKDWVEVNTSLYSPIEQGMIILNKDSELVRELYEFIQSDKVKEMIKESGYTF